MSTLISFAQRLATLGYSPSTCTNYSARLRTLFKALGSNLISLPPSHLQVLLTQYFQTQNCAFSTQKQTIRALKLYAQLLHDTVLSLQLHRPRRLHPLLILSRAEIHQLLATPQSLKHRVLLALIYSGGLRVSEVGRLQPQHIKVREGWLDIPAATGATIDRQVPLSVKLWPQLQAYYRQYRPQTWLFEGRSGRAYATSSIQRMFRQALKNSGLASAATVQTLRHSFAVHLLEQGTALLQVHRWLGHHSLRTTQRYLSYLEQEGAVVCNPLDWG